MTKIRRNMRVRRGLMDVKSELKDFAENCLSLSFGDRNDELNDKIDELMIALSNIKLDLQNDIKENEGK